MSLLSAILGNEIHIGFVPNISPEKQHGVAWMNEPGKGMASHPFTVDRPYLLENPSFWVVDQLFDQISKLGFFPDKIEIITADEHRVYEFGKIRPILRQRVLQ